MTSFTLSGARCAAGVFSTLALLASPAAQASDAVATITGFSLLADPGLTLTWLPASSFQSLYAESREAGGLGGQQLQEPAPGAWAVTSVQTATAHAAASGNASDSGLGAVLASASSALGSPLALPNTGASWLQQSGEFSLSGAGRVTLLLDYVLSASAGATESADTWAYAGLTLAFGNLFGDLGSTQSLSLYSADLPGHSGEASGRLILSADFGGPDQTGFYDLRLNANASAVAAVPEPAHWALMLAGAAVLALRHQRHRRRSH